MRQLKIATQITNRDSQAVEKYLQEISKIPMITPEEETTLAQRIKMYNQNPRDSQRALDKLVQANLRFVVSVAKQYQHQGLSLSDLINEGNLGLIKAAQRFDETKGFKFISYAVWWIRQSILQALAEQGRLVRLPQNKIGTYNKANKAYMAFEQEHEREPSTEELADILEMSETEINNIFRVIRGTLLLMHLCMRQKMWQWAIFLKAATILMMM
jgi:RNA polymerase primary sigma factor